MGEFGYTVNEAHCSILILCNGLVTDATSPAKHFEIPETWVLDEDGGKKGTVEHVRFTSQIVM